MRDRPLVADPDFTLYHGDVRQVLPRLPDASVDCVVTSPPYWGLRDYGADGQIGLEASPEEYVAGMVEVFRGVRRVLAPHGTLWLNLGDSYSHGGNGARDPERWPKQSRNDHRVQHSKAAGATKPKDLLGVPWRVALALQADGWYLRSDIIWAKPNPMPESVTDRPTKAHEYVFLLSKQPRYFYDADAIAEPARWIGPNGMPQKGPHAGQMRERAGRNHEIDGPVTRNARSVWEIQTQPYADAHFAVFPEELPRRCILAGCPEWVCDDCGKARERLVTKTPRIHPGDSGRTNAQGSVQRGKRADGKAIGTVMRERFEAGYEISEEWSDCGHNDYRPGTVLDPFMGSGTTALVARRLGRKSVGVELNADYCAMAARRLGQQSLLAEGAA